MTNMRAVFWRACLLEASLGVLALGTGIVCHRPLLRLVAGPVTHVLWGVLAAVLLLMVIIAIMRLRWGWIEAIRRIMNDCIRPVFGSCHWGDLLLISFLAGFGEELLFRGLVQDWLAFTLNPLAGLLLTSLVFGIIHCVNLPYAILTGLVGLGLGAMFQWSGSLVMPMAAHTAYDFLALLWFLRIEPSLKSHPSSVA